MNQLIGVKDGIDRLARGLRNGLDRNPASGNSPRNAPSTQGQEIPRLPQDDAEANRVYNSLPSGAVFIGPDGVQRRKP